MNSIKFKFTFLLLMLSFSGFADVELPKLFANGMVLQRNQKIPLWGWAKGGEKIAVQFKNQLKNTIADQSGKWKIDLDSEKEGGPFELKIKGENEIILKDVLIGDVWICSGQSNMEFPVGITASAQIEIEQANYPLIRCFNVPKIVSLQPNATLSGGLWKPVSPDNVKGFTAVGYFFARELYHNLKIPIGIISTNVGGTIIETWISSKAFEKSATFTDMISKIPKATIAEVNEQNLALLTAQITAVQGPLPKIKEVDQWKYSTFDDGSWKIMNIPGLWETKGWPKLDGSVWFRKEIIIDAEEALNAAVLNLGRIDETDEAFVNGVKVGETKARPTDERKYVIPAGVLKVGKNSVVIRVEDIGGGGGFGSPADKIYLTVGEKVFGLSGDWKYRIASVNANGFAIYPNTYPTLLFNAMIHPLTSYPIKGVIWYQGESNASRGYQYKETFPLLINDWRTHWKQGDLPFLFVQLANFSMDKRTKAQGSTWAELRESQLSALALPNTGMAVTTDIGDAKDIHPKNKQDVGKRLAAIALKKVYGKSIVAGGPVYEKYKLEGNRIIISFNSLESKLMIKDTFKLLKGFTIAGQDQKFFDASAYLKGNTVVVYSNKIINPVAVRYAWEDNPESANLFNKAGFPASSFRTDNWDLVTKNVMYQIGF